MKINKKQFGLLLLFFIIVMIGVALGIMYSPMNKLFKKQVIQESEFVNRQTIQTQAPNSLFFDFEVDPKTAEKSGFYKGIAHSGQFSAKAFGRNSFSYSVERKAGDIGLSNLKAVALSAWVYLFPAQKEIQASLVFSVSDNLGKNKSWKGIMVAGKQVPAGKWFKISGFFDLSEVSFRPDDKIQVYFWNDSQVDFLIDDYYIVFGGPRERKGDSTIADMTRTTGFRPGSNWPPFPDIYFEKEEIGNRNSGFLVNNGKEKAGAIRGSDRLFTGRFLGDPTGNDDLLVIGSDGTAELFSFCISKRMFKRIVIKNIQEFKSWFASSLVLTGSFTGQQVSEVLLIGKEKTISGCFEHLKDPCISSKLMTTFKIISDPGRTILNRFITEGSKLVAGDFNGDERTEILVLPADGSWKLFIFSGSGPDHGTFRQVADSKNNTIHCWDKKIMDFNISIGKFLPGINTDVVLTAGIEKTRLVYSIYLFDLPTNQFIPWFKKSGDFYGKIIGLDTLKRGDCFYTGKFLPGGGNVVLRYNRDWRYDLKQIRFSDSTFRILANVDFQGYEDDHNPKYYEMLKIIPGNFIDGTKTSLMIVGRNKNKTSSRILPDAIQVYTLKHSPDE